MNDDWYDYNNRYEEPYEWYGRSSKDPRCPDCGEYWLQCTCSDKQEEDEDGEV